MITRKKYLKALETVNFYIKQVYEQQEKDRQNLINIGFTDTPINENTKIIDADFPLIISNTFCALEIKTLGELKGFNRNDPKFKNLFERKRKPTPNELFDIIEKRLIQAGVEIFLTQKKQ